MDEQYHYLDRFECAWYLRKCLISFQLPETSSKGLKVDVNVCTYSSKHLIVKKMHKKEK